MKRILFTLLMLLAVGLGTSWAQTMITGRVIDEKGQGMVGATISVKGSPSIGTVTDLDGNFRLNAPANATLVIQSIGYATQEVSASAAGSIQMRPTAKELSGAVVTALAIRREKRELGYSATTIGSEDLNAGNNVSPLSAIQGKTAGVNITSTTGGPGGSTRVVLRGEKSVTGGNNALIVVDGIPVNNDARLQGLGHEAGDARSQIDFGNRGNDINPEDIESITVLKGPAAAALYGSIAANGAIMITTKTGRARRAGKKTSLSYQSSYYFSSPLKLPDFQNKYGQGDVDNIPDDHRENFSWGLPFNDSLRPWGQVIKGKQQIKPYSAQPNNVKDFFDIGQTWENNVQLGGSSDKGSYFLSLNTLNNKGIVPHTFFDRYSLRLNTSYDISDKVYSNINVNYVNTYQRVEETGQGQGSIIDNVIQQPRDIPIPDLRDLNNIFNSYGVKDSLGVAHYGYYGAYTDNPYFLAENVDNRNRTDRIIGSAVIGYRPNEHWDIFDRLGIDYISDRFYNKQPKYDLVPWDVDYYFAGGSTQNRTSNGGYVEAHSSSLNFYNDLIANYTRQLSADIGFTGLAGANVRVERNSYLEGAINYQTNGLVVPGYYNLNNNQGILDVQDVQSERRRIGLYTDLRLDYRRAIFLELTARNDWSSSLAENNRSFFYPSVSASWVFTETLKDRISDRFLSYGKIRGGYASVGNDAAAYQNNNPAYGRTISETGFGSIKTPFNGTPAFSYSNVIGNLDLKPERTNSTEAGIELSFLRNRISLEATYYYNLSIDQIIYQPMPPSSGYTSRVLNLGDVENKGVELAARFTPVQTRSGFKWELYGTYTKNQNEVLRLANGVRQVNLGGISGMTATATVGLPYGALYGTDLARDAQGRVIVDSTTGMPKIGPNTVYKGSYQPRFIASWGTNLRFKGFALNVLFDTKQGGVFFSRTKDIMDFVGTAQETEYREDHVFPNSVYQSSNGGYVVNTDRTFHPYNYYTNVIPAGQHVIDASYVKLREASLSYTVPERWLKRSFLGSATVGVFGNNLFIWTPSENKYGDPEMNSGGASNLQGFDFSSRLSLRNYGFNLRVTF